MHRILYSLFVYISGICCEANGQIPCDSMMYLDNGKAALGIQAFGGAITDFRFKGSKINPFTWSLKASDMPPNNRKGAPFRGHFLCLGRWGAPTSGEMAAGIPHNGEAGSVCWQMMPPARSLQLEMYADAPRDGMQVRRTLQMDPMAAVVKVKESVRSTATLIRPFNMVQHSTIGPPFLDTTTRIYCNAAEGFMQSLSYPDPHLFSYRWPAGIRDSLRRPVDLLRSSEPVNYVTSHIFREDIGWITAFNPKSGLLVGYVWLVKDYPWVNVWQHWQDGSLKAKGLEFGTTGIGRSYQELLAADTRFYGVPSFVFLDAGETIEKSYLLFMLEVPRDFNGVEQLLIRDGAIQMQERGAMSRTFKIGNSLSLN